MAQSSITHHQPPCANLLLFPWIYIYFWDFSCRCLQVSVICFVFNEGGLQSVAALWGIMDTSNFQIFSEFGIVFPRCTQTWIKMLHWLYLETRSLRSYLTRGNQDYIWHQFQWNIIIRYFYNRITYYTSISHTNVYCLLL